MSGVTGTFVDGGVETITGGTSGAAGTLDIANTNVNRFLINGVEGQSVTLTDDNTYRYDTSDASNVGHPLALGDTIAGVSSRTQGNVGTAGSYFEIVVAPGVAALSLTTYLNCTVHGQGMIEPGTVAFQTGTAGQSGTGMTANITVTGDAVTAVTILTQGQNIKVGDVLIIDNAGVGGTGSGFQYTINSNNTGITSVTNISLDGSGYAIGEVLSVADNDVGEAGGSGFQYTISNVGFVTAIDIQDPGQAYELADTLILGPVGGVNTPQGTGLAVSLAALDPIKSLELTQAGALNMGVGGAAQMSLTPEGTITATQWNITSSGVANLASVITSGSVTVTGLFAVSDTSGFTGRATFNGGITVSGADSSVDRASVKLVNGDANAPSLSFTNSTQTGLFRQAADAIGISFAGTEGIRLDGTNYLDTQGLQVNSTRGSTTPFLKVETATPKLSIGAAATQIEINNACTISTSGTDIDVPLTFDTKGGGDYTFKGGTNVDLVVDDGTTEVFKLETSTGTATFSGNLDAGKLRIRQNVIANNSTGASRSFGEVTALTVTGVGSGYTNGTYTATATTSTGGGTGCTVTLTVASGTFSAVTVVDKGQNYAVGDELTITAAGGGSGLAVTVSNIEGKGIVLKPSAGNDILCDTTGSLVIPSGTTNERPLALDRITGAIRFNTSQLQFEGFNGNDFVSLGGVRDVDQDTFVLTEVSPGSDEDTFEFYNVGVNSLSISQTKFTIRTAKTVDVQGTLRIDGVTSSEDPLIIQRGSTDIVKIRDKKDFEVCDGSTSGLRLRALPVTGTIATIGTVTSNGNNYGLSATYTGVASTGVFGGTGATFTVVTNGSGGISTVTIVSGGTGYEVGEIIKIAGNLLGGVALDDDITFPILTLSSTIPPFSRMDIVSQDYVTQMDEKPFLSYDSNGAQAAFKINRGWAANTQNYLTDFY